MEVPGQHMDVKVASAYQQGVEKFSEPVGKAVGLAINQCADSAVEVPAEDHDAVTGFNRDGSERTEEGVAVDQKGRALGALDAPAIASGDEQRRRRGLRARGRPWRLPLQFR